MFFSDCIFFLLLGSEDSTVRLWSATRTARGLIELTETRQLFGHDSVLTCVAVNRDMDVVASGSKVKLYVDIICHVCCRWLYPFGGILPFAVI